MSKVRSSIVRGVLILKTKHAPASAQKTSVQLRNKNIAISTVSAKLQIRDKPSRRSLPSGRYHGNPPNNALFIRLFPGFDQC